MRCLIYDNIEQLIFNCSSQNLKCDMRVVVDTELALLERNAGLPASTTTPIFKVVWQNIYLCKLAKQIVNHDEIMRMNSNLKANSPDKEYRFNKLF